MWFSSSVFHFYLTLSLTSQHATACLSIYNQLVFDNLLISLQDLGLLFSRYAWYLNWLGRFLSLYSMSLVLVIIFYLNFIFFFRKLWKIWDKQGITTLDRENPLKEMQIKVTCREHQCLTACKSVHLSETK